MIVVYSPKAEAHLNALTKKVTARILEKVDWYCEQSEPLQFAVALSGTKERLYRFRIGDYRAIFMLKDGVPTILFVIAVKHRKEAYR